MLWEVVEDKLVQFTAPTINPDWIIESLHRQEAIREVRHKTIWSLCVEMPHGVKRYRMTSEARAYERLACYREDDREAWIEKQRITEWERVDA